MTGAQARRDAALVAASKIGVSALVLATGFRALSDDDFARVVIAQTFAAAPSLDPSGTSWLPFPFWLQGTIMGLAGSSVAVARATSFTLGVASGLLVYAAARMLGVARPGALLGALLACFIPYAAWLGVATVPDGFTAALILLAAASAGSQARGRRWLGAAALLIATLSRYEAWPVAAAFSAFTAHDAWRDRRWKATLPAVLAVAGPLAWLLHGAVHHGDALFFVSRVAAYHRAVGAAPDSILARVVGYPLAVLRCEPELCSVTLLALLAAWRSGLREALRRHARLGILLAALLAFLVVGDLRDTAPTHHAERTLLAIWLGCAVVSGDLLTQWWQTAGPRHRIWLVTVAAALTLVAALVARPWYARRDDFIDRSLELDIGQRALHADAGAAGRLLVDTPDFGFYAVLAGFSQPQRARAFDRRDPRQPRGADAFASAAALRQRLDAEGAGFMVVTRERAALARAVGTVRAENDRFLLVDVVQQTPQFRPPSRP